MHVIMWMWDFVMSVESSEYLTETCRVNGQVKASRTRIRILILYITKLVELMK